MLKNLSIRDRLTLILLGPLVVLLAIAALAVRDNLDTSSGTNDAAFRVEMAQVNGRLFEAVRQEAAANQRAVALANVDLTDVQAETDASGAAWLERIERYRDLDVNGLEVDIRGIADVRQAASVFHAGGAAGAEPVYGADIALLTEIAAFDGRLNGRGESTSAAGLLKASQLTDAALATADAQLLGLWAAYSGEVPSSALAAQLAASEAALDAYGNRAQADEQVAESTDAYTAMSRPFAELVVGDGVTVDPDAWGEASESRAAAIEEVKQALLLKTGLAVNEEASTARANMRNVGLLALAGLLVGAALLFFVVKSIRSSLGEINAEATTLAKSDLPKLAASLAAGQPIGSHEERPLLDTSGNDEIAEVAESLNEIRRSTSNVAQQQSDLLQSGIADMFVNLARRNQSLVDRQLEVIDDLEAQERDADRLAHLYRVDHLATRMRRNAESLLVLADNTTPRRRGDPVELREVVRVAIGEVEDYRRIVPIALDDLRVAAHVAHDVAHLLSELMENATQSSPPGTVADVVGVVEPDSSYTIHVMDRGTGIDDDRRSHLNRVLAEPPTNTLSMSKTLGLTVVGRLARRMGLNVSLNPGTEGGTVATVSVPADVVAEWSGDNRSEYAPLGGAQRDSAAPQQVEPPTVVDTPAPHSVEPELPAAVPEPPAPPPMDLPIVAEVPLADSAPVEMPALQDLSPLPPLHADLDAPAPSTADDEAISGLPAFPTLGPPEDEPTPPSVSDLPGDDVFGAHDPIPETAADYAPPPSVGDVFGGPDVVASPEPVVSDDVFEAPAVEPMAPETLTPIAADETVPEAPSDFPPSIAPPFIEPAPIEPVPVEPGDVFSLPDSAMPDSTIPDGAPPAPAEAAPPAPAEAAPVDDPFAEVMPIPEAPTAPPFADPSGVDVPQAPAHAAPGPDPLLMPDPVAPVSPSMPAHAAAPESIDPVHVQPGPFDEESVPDAGSVPAPEPEPTLASAHAVAGAHAAPEAVAPSPEIATTPSGLVKRKRGAASLPDVSGPSGDRAAPSKRSPDQVKNMLSRYKTGLQRGRTDTDEGGQS